MVRYFFNVVVPVMRLFPGCWDSSSSFHVTFGETYEQAARGELKEETGISAPLTYLGKFSYHIPPRTRSLQYSTAEVMILSRLIQRNPEHHFTEETKLTRLLHPRKQHPGAQGAGRY